MSSYSRALPCLIENIVVYIAQQHANNLPVGFTLKMRPALEDHISDLVKTTHKSFYHGHGLFLQFFGFFRSVEDLFTSAYYAGNQAVKQEASL